MLFEIVGILHHLSEPRQISEKQYVMVVVLDLTHTYQGVTYRNYCQLQALNNTIGIFQDFELGSKVRVWFSIYGYRKLMPMYQALVDAGDKEYKPELYPQHYTYNTYLRATRIQPIEVYITPQSPPLTIPDANRDNFNTISRNAIPEYHPAYQRPVHPSQQNWDE